MLIETELPSPRGTAVIIEDDLDIRNLMCAVLRQAGFDVHPAATGLEGVELVRSTRAAIVTVDIGLPDIDGHEVTRRIRGFSDCHVLVVSGRTTRSDREAALQCGADDYLDKPFRPRELTARIHAVIPPLVTRSAPAAPVRVRSGSSAGSVVRGSRRPTTVAHEPAAFLPAVAGRTSTRHAISRVMSLLHAGNR